MIMREIIIAGHQMALNIVKSNSNKYNTIVIDSIPKTQVSKIYLEALKYSYDALCLYYDENDYNTKESITENAIGAAIEWGSKARLHLLITCPTGINKSPALAAVIAAKRAKSVQAGIEILHKKLHMPKSSIVALGAKYIDLPELVTAVD